MEGLKLLDLQMNLQRWGILINFSGRFTQGIIEELGDAVKRHLELEMISQNETYNAFSVFVEQTQNIKTYGAKIADVALKDRIVNSGIVAIGKSANGYFVTSGNMIVDEDAAALRGRLDEILTLDKAALKKLYKEQMRRELPPGSDSAGMGFIDMARRASRPIQYSIEKQEEGVSFFTLEVYI